MHAIKIFDNSDGYSENRRAVTEIGNIFVRGDSGTSARVEISEVLRI
jgi:hypothetical protein